jgi:uncharacterized membrane protein
MQPDAAPLSTDELPIGRLDAFSDGVFAIAITLLALELTVGSDAANHPLQSILDEWPSYLAYVTSFLTIGVVWITHSTITKDLRAADGTLYRLNLLVLLFASFLPFPTKLISEFADTNEAERVAVVFYGLTLLALVIALTFLRRYTFEQTQLLKDDVNEQAARAAADHRPSYLFYAVAIVIGIFAPTVAVALYLGIGIYLGVPATTIRRLARRGSQS